MRWIRALLVVSFCAVLLGLAPGARADCSAPNAPEGVILYNTDENVPQFCDDTNWVRMAPPAVGLPSEGLIAYWPFDETAGTIATDVIGGFDGTLYGGLDFSANSTTGRVGSALQFDGNNNDIDTTSPVLGDHSFSAAFWFKWEGSGNNWILDNGSDSDGGFQILTDSNTLRARLDDSGANSAVIDTATPINDGQWHHAVLTVDKSGDMILYLDGRQDGTTADVSSFGDISGTINFLIARSSQGSGGKFQGILDDVRLYNRALTPEEIARCCSGLVTPADKGDFTSNLVGHWTLDETTGTIAYDSAGTNDGTMEGGLTASNNAVNGPRNGALDFDGTDDYVEIPRDPAFEPSNEITVAAWIYWNDHTTGQYQKVIAKSNVVFASPWQSYAISQDDTTNSLYFEAAINGGAFWTQPYVTIPLDQWVHVTASWKSGDYLRLYVNGAEVATSAATHTGTLTYYNTPLRIGRSSNDIETNTEWDGRIDDVRIYDRALIANDIKALYLNSAKYCENPGGVPGQIHYNGDTRAPMYCDGGHWVALAPEPLSKGLVGHWKLDEASGTLADSSGLGNDGTETGGIGYASAGMIGPAVYLDGTDDFVRIPRSPALEPAAVTVAAWVKRDGDQVRWATMVKKTWKNNSSPTWVSYSLELNITGSDSSRISFYTGESGGLDVMTSTTGQIPDGTWVHVVGVYDPAGPAPQKKLYINGALYDSKELTSPLVYQTTSTGDLYFGQTGDNDNYFKGLLDDVRIYNRALSAAEIEALYKHGLADDGLIAHWPLDEDGGTVARDIIGGHHGTASGGVVFSSAGGRIGGAAVFDGVDDIVNFGDPADGSLDLGPNFTIAFWFNPSINNVLQELIRKQGGGCMVGHSHAFRRHFIWPV